MLGTKECVKERTKMKYSNNIHNNGEKRSTLGVVLDHLVVLEA